MITYADGWESRYGDRVELDGIAGVVEAVIDDEAERSRWGLDERGIMVKTVPYGLIFEPVDSVSWPAVILLGRAGA